MKAALSLLAVVGLTSAMTFGASASSRPGTTGTASLRSTAVHLSPFHVPSFSGRRVPMQTGGTATPGTTPTAAPTASPTPVPPSPTPTSGPNYPDPVDLLGTAIQKLMAVNSITFTLKQAAEQTNVERISISASGVANCKADYVHVKGSDTILGTSQTKKVEYWFEQTKKLYYKKQVVNDKTHHTWKKVTQKATWPFGFSGWSVDNPLPCFVPSGSTGSGSSGSGSTGSALRNLTNLGPVTYAGVKSWHIQATDDGQDSQGNPQHLTLEYFVSQDTTVLVGFKATFTDPNHDITETAEQKFTKPGQKVKIPKIKTGSKKP